MMASRRRSVWGNGWGGRDANFRVSTTGLVFVHPSFRGVGVFIDILVEVALFGCLMLVGKFRLHFFDDIPSGGTFRRAVALVSTDGASVGASLF